MSKKILVKVGSNVLTLSSGAPNEERIEQLVAQISNLKKQGHQVVLVSSGAVAAGRAQVEIPDNLDIVSQKQVLSAVGQITLMNLYNTFFKEYNYQCAQVLITKESFSTREHYLNMTNCIEALLKCDITPIVNENDVVSTAELMFTDNDEISGMLATMIQAEELLILSNINGIYTAPPTEPDAKLIRSFDLENIDLDTAIGKEKSKFGRGGMLTKVNTASKISKMGVNVSIGNGNIPDIMNQLLERTDGTFFKAEFDENQSAVKKWINHSKSFTKGVVYLNNGALKAILNDDANSILPIGIEKIEGHFEKGEIISIANTHGKTIGYGKAAYDSDLAQEYINTHDQPPLIHYNFLILE